MTAAAQREIRLGGAPVALHALRGADELTLPAGPPIDRAALLVAASAPGLDADALTLGDFNRALLAIHALNWGETADAVARCPADGCGARMDVPLDFGAMLTAWSDTPPNGPIVVESAGMRALLRPLRVGDLRAAVASADARAALVDRVVESVATPAGAPLPADALARDPAALAAAEAALTDADPFARLTVRGACPACGRETPLTVEPMAFALAPLSDRERLLDEVDRIARAYHWSEAEILGLPVARRRAYLARIAAAEAPVAVRRGAAA
jgi:hypothetical protein